MSLSDTQARPLRDRGEDAQIIEIFRQRVTPTTERDYRIECQKRLHRGYFVACWFCGVSVGLFAAGAIFEGALAATIAGGLMAINRFISHDMTP